MVLRPLRQVSLPDPARAANHAWLEKLDAKLSAPSADWYRVCREALFHIWYPGLEDYDRLAEDPATPSATRVQLLALDPRHVTLEPEYYAEVDAERFARVKPLLWLWYSFDR
ncbi:MAG TPA: hypothetical protein VGQ17_09685, partial [Gemmatimonadales bacterium]|nr:hypothetical protein [Gemmatimonadales bacterium]